MFPFKFYHTSSACVNTEQAKIEFNIDIHYRHNKIAPSVHGRMRLWRQMYVLSWPDERLPIRT
jgi:hypothetical protein